MENIITRHRNLTILAVVLFAQLLGLAYQVKKTTDRGSTRLVRVWSVAAITPLEKAFVHSVRSVGNAWRNYAYLRDVRRENDELRREIQRLQLERVSLAQDVGQAQRLQALLGFKQQFISQTMPAQVISTTGSEFSRGIYIDKGSRDGMKPDMPVITPEGIVGKVYRVYPMSSLVLEINDPSSGAGVILEKSRLQGILKGSATGETFVSNIMADEKIDVGEKVLTSGGDRVYPKGLSVGSVNKVWASGTFLTVQVKPSAPMDRLEEVLVITRIVERASETVASTEPARAVDILAGRLPSVPPPPPPKSAAASGTAGSSAAVAKPTNAPPPNAGLAGSQPKPAAAPATAPVTKIVAPATGGPGAPAPAAGETARPAPANTAANGTKTEKPKPAEPPKPDTSAKEPPR